VLEDVADLCFYYVAFNKYPDLDRIQQSTQEISWLRVREIYEEQFVVWDDYSPSN
jgi:hypothetical protein